MKKTKSTTVTCKGLKLTLGRGVLAKDGKTPWAAGTLHVTTLRDGQRWRSAIDYTMGNIMKAMMDEAVVEISLIDQNNNQFDLAITR